MTLQINSISYTIKPARFDERICQFQTMTHIHTQNSFHTYTLELYICSNERNSTAITLEFVNLFYPLSLIKYCHIDLKHLQAHDNKKKPCFSNLILPSISLTKQRLPLALKILAFHIALSVYWPYTFTKSTIHTISLLI